MYEDRQAIAGLRKCGRQRGLVQPDPPPVHPHRGGLVQPAAGALQLVADEGVETAIAKVPCWVVDSEVRSPIPCCSIASSAALPSIRAPASTAPYALLDSASWISWTG